MTTDLRGFFGNRESGCTRGTKKSVADRRKGQPADDGAAECAFCSPPPEAKANGTMPIIMHGRHVTGENG